MHKSFTVGLTGLIFFFVFASPALAQKNRSIMRDAATIVEVLQRDYTLIENLTPRMATIHEDRKKVISIFRAYTLPDTAFGCKVKVPELDSLRIQSQKVPLDAAAIKAHTAIEDSLYRYDTAVVRCLIDYFEGNKANNPLLASVLKTLRQKFKAVHEKNFDPFGTSLGSGEVEKGLVSLGSGLTFTNAIDGLATFLAKRIKEELATQLFDHIQTELQDTSPNAQRYEELKILLPKTFFLLTTIQPYEYPGFINSLKENIQADLNATFENIQNLQYTTRMKALLAKHPDLVLVFDGLRLINELNRSRSAIEVVFTLENSTMVERWAGDPRFQDLANGIKLASLLTYASSVPYPDSRRFVSVNEWDKQTRNMDFNKLFLGFLLQQDLKYFRIKFKDKLLAETLLAKTDIAQSYYDAFNTRIREIAMSATALEEEGTTIKRLLLEDKRVSHDTIAHFLHNSLTLLDSIFSLTEHMLEEFTQTPVTFRPKASNYLSFGHTAIDIYSDLGNKNYFNALLEGISLVEKAKLKGRIGNIDHVLFRYEYISSIRKKVKDGANAMTQEVLDDIKVLVADIDACGCTDFSALSSITLAELQGSAEKFNLVKGLKDRIPEQEFGKYIFCVIERSFEKKLRESGFSWDDYPNLKNALAQVKEKSWEAAQEVFTASLMDLARQPYVNRNDDVLRLLNFVVAVSKAETAQDFEKAVEAIVLPAGSSIIKREAAVNLAINAYPGFFFGREFIHDVDESGAGNFAVTAPIGVAFSASLSKGSKPASLTFFASAIDIGAFTSVRFRSEDAPLPEITFKNILAPGIHLILGFPKSPFAIGVGAQYGPMLREVEITKDENGNNLATPILDDRTAYRFGLSVLMDIPFLNIYTKSKSLRACE